MNLRLKIMRLMVLLVLLATCVFPAMAAGPDYVTGTNATQPGQPYRWAGNSIGYTTDLGSLGNQTNEQADAMIASAFQVWGNVSTANVNFPHIGDLSYDVTGANILEFQNALGNCSDSSQPANAIVYDLDGSVITALGLDRNSVVGFVGVACTNDTAGLYTRGWIVMNGRFLDGQPNSPEHRSLTPEDFQGVLINLSGHLIGLGNSQINLNCMVDLACPAEDLAGLPAMFPVFLNESQKTLKTDDIASISMLYPASNFYSTSGRIQGHVMFADKLTPAQGYNVIARQIGNPRSTAVSSVSGFLFTAGVGNPLVPDGGDSFFYGSHDTNLIGYYDIPGLPPGSYTLEVEAIHNSGAIPFVGTFGVGPIGHYLGFQFKMPGTCNPQYLNYPSLPGDSCSAQTTITVGAGQVVSTNTDIILIGTLPRLDEWEEDP